MIGALTFHFKETAFAALTGGGPFLLASSQHGKGGDVL
ncbi:hypothetical protein E6C60_1128 [Paenibacillus algicola]|uniref:Uncharacterized protein n=1 Tax=Paenibacillus algicola TaxID=2565926 RepID=A0A4P8XH66_9BACL|nr:hypothetical protein E6C60_1128 [Paenibacillus algicola]